MRMSKLLGERFKEKPADCHIDSHILMVRGGYIKQVTTGVYSLYTPAKRIAKKIEQIIREEMDAIDGQEVMFPVTMPASLWERSGRYTSVDENLVRFNDRSGAPMVLGMTHEEASVDLAAEAARSYAQYPFMIYQIQTKFRDELRSRAGLIRVREFTMKDAYSFHTSGEDLQAYYDRCHKAYERIFARCGLPQVISVESDTGMMGGKIAHEFMLLTDIGEDSLVLCPHCQFRANMEAAPCIVSQTPAADSPELRTTPGVTAIEDVCRLLGTAPAGCCKAVVYQGGVDDSPVLVFLRGDLEVNETKLRNHIGQDVHPARELSDPRIVTGFIGPMGLDKSLRVVFDRSLEGAGSLVCGANQPDAHYTGVDITRDCGVTSFADVAKAAQGGVCPVCGKAGLDIRRGIEVGNIFQLGDKYSRTMDMRYTDSDGTEKHPVMGCYGIGVGRLMASVCEASHDEHGPIWPLSIAPWQLHLCALRPDAPEVGEMAERLYEALTAAGVEVLYDDRGLSAGVTFADADLLGVPLRLVVSPRGLQAGALELTSRDKTLKTTVAPSEVLSAVQKTLLEIVLASPSAAIERQ